MFELFCILEAAVSKSDEGNWLSGFFAGLLSFFKGVYHEFANYLMELKDQLLESGVSKSKDFIIKLILSIIVFYIGRKLIKLFVKLLKKSLFKSKMEEGAAGFLVTFIRAGLHVALIIIIVGILGMPSSSIIALLGSAGLAIGLALQGSLSNFAGGVLILLLKPFQVGDYIIVVANEGTVIGIDIFYTKLLTADNRRIVMPNGALSNMNIMNATKEPIRRLDLLIPIDHSSDISKVKELLLQIADSSELVLKEQPVDVFVNSLEQSVVNIGFRTWVATEEFWNLKWEILEKIKTIFEAEEIAIPNNQVDIHVVQKPDLK